MCCKVIPSISPACSSRSCEYSPYVSCPHCLLCRVRVLSCWRLLSSYLCNCLVCRHVHTLKHREKWNKSYIMTLLYAAAVKSFHMFSIPTRSSTKLFLEVNRPQTYYNKLELNVYTFFYAGIALSYFCLH